MNKIVLLSWILRLHAALLLAALLAILLPTSVMNTIHNWLGMGELPAAPIVEYLTRSLSLIYALHGAVCFTLALDVRKYLPLIETVAIFHFVLGGILLAIDWHSELPWYWTLFEGPPIMAFALFIYWFARSCRDESSGESALA